MNPPWAGSTRAPGNRRSSAGAQQQRESEAPLLLTEAGCPVPPYDRLTPSLLNLTEWGAESLSVRCSSRACWVSSVNPVSEGSICLTAVQPLLESNRSTMATPSPSTNSPTSAAGSALHTQHLTTMSNMQGKRRKHSVKRLMSRYSVMRLERSGTRLGRALQCLQRHMNAKLHDNVSHTRLRGFTAGCCAEAVGLCSGSRSLSSHHIYAKCAALMAKTAVYMDSSPRFSLVPL